MSNNMKSTVRWSLIMGYLGTISLIMACMAIGMGSSTGEQEILQLDNGLVKVRVQNGDLEPVAGTSTFELVGTLESVDPLRVAGRLLQQNESTQIAEGLQPGDLVRVRGIVLDKDTWLAHSVEAADEQNDQTIIIIGEVTSIDPWVVNGITLDVADTTVINGQIKPGMLVRVEILLLDDGTWEVISISPLGDLVPTSGCATIIATIVSVSGDQVQFLGWPAPISVGNIPQDGEENGDEGNDGVDLTILQPGQQVLVVVCVSENKQLVIVKITILDPDDGEDTGNGGKVLVCHKPDKKGGHTLSISSSAVPAHLGHGDKLGACP